MLRLALLTCLIASNAYAQQDCDQIKQHILRCQARVDASCSASPPLNVQYRKCLSDAARESKQRAEQQPLQADENYILRPSSDPSDDPKTKAKTREEWLAVPQETLDREAEAAAEANKPPPDPKLAERNRKIAYSGLYCAFVGERTQNMAAIQELRNNMRMGGAVDMSDLKDYTDWVREAERNMKKIRATLKSLLPCSNAIVRQVAACGVPTQYSGVTGYENFQCVEEYKAGYADYQALEY